MVLVEPDERGDPESPLRWTTKSLRHLAQELNRQGYSGSAPTDTKKREQIGNRPTAGREWRPQGEPVEVEDHHFFFSGPDVEHAIPYGIYDLARNTGWVNVGVDHDTCVFAVESIRRWWRMRGSLDYPDATRLVTADTGGSNGYRYRVWKSPPTLLVGAACSQRSMGRGTRVGDPTSLAAFAQRIGGHL